MPDQPTPPDPRLARRRPTDEELDRVTTADAMQNFVDDATRLWDQSSGLAGLIDAAPQEDATT